MLRELESLQSPVPNPSRCCLAGNGALLPHIPQDCTHTPQNRITFPCQLLNPASPEISDKSGCLGAPFFGFLCREGERKEMFIKTNRLHHSVCQAYLNCTAGYPCSINITPQFTEKVSLVGIDNYTLHKHQQKL